jgi:nucleotide-binding universal stress UspA family protein
MNAQHLIIVGVDAAWQRSGALNWALHEAVQRRIPLRAVHVVDDRLRKSYGGPVVIDGQTVTVAPVPEHDTRLVDDLERYVAAADPKLDLGADVLVGPPDKRLAELSAEAELTVVGRRGLGTFTRLLIGSTSEAVANHGEGPVVVVPDRWQPERHAGGPVVVGVDGIDQSEAAVEFAFEMAAARKVPLWMVHVWDVPTAHTWDTAAISGVHDRWKEIASRRVHEIAERWHDKYPDVDLHEKIRQSHPVLGLLDACVATDAQLLVVGGHRHNRVSGMLVGSVARGVLHHADIPVAVVHERRTTA